MRGGGESIEKDREGHTRAFGDILVESERQDLELGLGGHEEFFKLVGAKDRADSEVDGAEVGRDEIDEVDEQMVVEQAPGGEGEGAGEVDEGRVGREDGEERLELGVGRDAERVIEVPGGNRAGGGVGVGLEDAEQGGGGGVEGRVGEPGEDVVPELWRKLTQAHVLGSQNNSVAQDLFQASDQEL